MQEEPSPSLTDALFHHTEAHQKNAQNDQQNKTTQNIKNSKKTRRQLPVDFDSSSMSDSETSTDDFSPGIGFLVFSILKKFPKFNQTKIQIKKTQKLKISIQKPK